MSAYDLSDIRVLVLEDSTFMARLLNTMLGALGIKNITVIRDINQFMPVLEDRRIDLILTDWEMNSFTGEDVVKMLRLSPDSVNPFVPVIAISAHTDMEHIADMLACGVDDVIAKPLSAKELYYRVVRLIDRPPEYVRSTNYLGPKRNLAHLEARAG